MQFQTSQILLKKISTGSRIIEEIKKQWLTFKMQFWHLPKSILPLVMETPLYPLQSWDNHWSNELAEPQRPITFLFVCLFVFTSFSSPRWSGVGREHRIPHFTLWESTSFNIKKFTTSNIRKFLCSRLRNFSFFQCEISFFLYFSFFLRKKDTVMTLNLLRKPCPFRRGLTFTALQWSLAYHNQTEDRKVCLSPTHNGTD